MKPKPSGSRRDETTAVLQQATATSLTNPTLFAERMDRLDAGLEKGFAEIDQRFERIESLLQRMFAELPEGVFGFGQAAGKKPPG